MSNIRKQVIVSVLIMIIFSLTSCGPRFYASEYDVGLEYVEWADEIGLFSHENLKVRRYKEEISGVKLELEYDNGVTGYKELCDVVNAHNKFVEENPDYFPNDFNVTFTNKYASEYSPSFFSNIRNGSNGLGYISELGREDSAKLLYMCISVDGDHTENKENADIHIGVPIVILQSYNESYTPKGEAYAFLKEFDNIEQVIIDFWEPGYDKNGVLDAIREYAPNAEIYEVKSVNREDHLEKCP